MNKKKILGIVRHVLTFGGGWVANSGYIAASEVEGLVGAVMLIVGTVWSAFSPEKKES